MTIGDRIKDARTALDMTLEDVAQQVGLSRQTLSRYETGVISNIPSDKIEELAKALKTSPSYLMGWEERLDRMTTAYGNGYVEGRVLSQQPNIFSYVRGRRLPVLGAIPAGVPILAVENIEGYDYADVPEGENYFFLRVRGDSMINARIFDGDLVLVKAQDCAENGNIAVCVVNGDEATLKRFFRQDNVIVLQPENAAYEPVIIPVGDFDNGYARIIGVVTEARHKYKL